MIISQKYVIYMVNYESVAFTIMAWCWFVSRVLVGEPEGKRPLGRPRRRWEDNIKMDVGKVI
jgi:hypothetical protein